MLKISKRGAADLYTIDHRHYKSSCRSYYNRIAKLTIEKEKESSHIQRDNTVTDQSAQCPKNRMAFRGC